MHVIVYSKVRLFSETLAEWLQTHDKIIIVKPCCQLETLIRRTETLHPDIILFDICGEHSLDEANTVSRLYPDLCLLAIALPDIADDFIACVDAGFMGYFPRNAPLIELFPAMQKTINNECLCDPLITAGLIKELHRRRETIDNQGPTETLTKRENEVLGLLGRGMCNKEIARELKISDATVKNHLHNVFIKLHVRGRTEAVAKLKDSPWLAQSA